MKTIKEEIIFIKKRNKLFDSLRTYAENGGYIKVESDLFEGVFDFVNTNNRFNISELIKLEDKKGDLFILRPDITTNIIKQVIPRISKDDELKLYYLDKIYAYNQRGEMKAIRQFGVELIGGNSYEKEVQLLSFIEGLLDQYQMDYVIEIGNQFFVDILISEITSNQKLKPLIKDALMKKNEVALNVMLDVEDTNVQLLFMVLDPLNNINTIQQFIKENQLNKQLLEELNRTMMISEKMNQENIMIDLSLISPYDYYNGPIFKGYIPGYEKDIFRGGRYDTLTENYGTLTKALGFSLDMSPFMKEVL